MTNSTKIKSNIIELESGLQKCMSILEMIAIIKDRIEATIKFSERLESVGIDSTKQRQKINNNLLIKARLENYYNNSLEKLRNTA